MTRIRVQKPKRIRRRTRPEADTLPASPRGRLLRSVEALVAEIDRALDDVEA